MTQASKHRTAKIYFKIEFGQLVKSMAARIRDQKSHCHLVNAAFFKGPEDVEACDLVLVQRGAKNAKMIAACYEKFGKPGVEVVFFDDNGEVVSENEPEKPAERPAVEPVAATADTGEDAKTGTERPAVAAEGDSAGDAEG